jgi:hypothetical protein
MTLGRRKVSRYDVRLLAVSNQVVSGPVRQSVSHTEGHSVSLSVSLNPSAYKQWPIRSLSLDTAVAGGPCSVT